MPDSSPPASSTAVPEDHLHLLAEEIALSLPAVEEVLSDVVAATAADLGRSCGITYRARYGNITVASSDGRANALDELQYGFGAGPCLEAMHTRPNRAGAKHDDGAALGRLSDAGTGRRGARVDLAASDGR